MNLAVLALALLGSLVLAVVVMQKYAIGEGPVLNSLPLPWFQHSVNIPPLPDRSPTIGMTAETAG
jgi:hypothetical protein